MKTFDLKEFNQDGNKFFSVDYVFNVKEGLTIKTTELSVRKRSGVCPANGCDFVSSTGSTSSSNFFENNQVLDINDLFFNENFDFNLKGFVYCLPENKTMAIANLEQQINAFVKRKVMLIESNLYLLKRNLK